jgi:hypothetical protein
MVCSLETVYSRRDIFHSTQLPRCCNAYGICFKQVLVSRMVGLLVGYNFLLRDFETYEIIFVTMCIYHFTFS